MARPQNFPGRRPPQPYQGQGNAYGRTHGFPSAGMVGPIPGGRGPHTGAEGSTLDWMKEHKWYLLGGGLIAAAAVTYFATRR